jgi:hypothetical protein
VSITEQHFNDATGAPEGGITQGCGFVISWQRGPLGRPPERKEPNGAFVDDVIRAVIGRITHYESTRFTCSENRAALDYLRSALSVLNARTNRREIQGVEGTHGIHERLTP